MKVPSAVDEFRRIASQARFKGWPIVGDYTLGEEIPLFGQTVTYHLNTARGFLPYTSILRYFGWAVVFGITVHNGRPSVVTLVQWKPGVNQASWELSPGGIGKIGSDASLEHIGERTKEMYLKETGYGNGVWTRLGEVMIETGKYRGASFEGHGLPAHLYLATGLERLQGARQPLDIDIMETLLVPLDEFPEVLASGLFTETSAVACAFKALLTHGSLCWR